MRHLNLNYLLIFIPIALGLYWFGAKPLLVFAMAALTIVPLSKIVGSATETLGDYLGPTLGGLLNASMGNAPELIIGAFALKNGLITVVKASLTGSIIGNLLLTLGLAMFAGGLRYSHQKFNVHAARLSMSMMFLAVGGLMVPALFHFTSRSAEHEISLQIAAILLVVYVLSLVYTLFTHRNLFKVDAASRTRSGEDPVVEESAGIAGSRDNGSGTDERDPHRRARAGNKATGDQRGLRRHHPAGLGQQHLRHDERGRLRSQEPDGSGREQRDRSRHPDRASGRPRPRTGQPSLADAHGLCSSAGSSWSRSIISIFIARNMTIDGESDWLEGAMLVAVFLMLGIGFYYAN